MLVLVEIVPNVLYDIRFSSIDSFLFINISIINIRFFNNIQVAYIKIVDFNTWPGMISVKIWMNLS